MRWLSLLLCFVTPWASADVITGRVSGVLDGDTLTVVDAGKKRYRVRLADVDAPEIGQAFGKRSRRSLSELCMRKPVEVAMRGKDGSRHVADVACAGVDASAEQVKRGMAWVSVRLTPPGSPLFELEGHARLRQIGLWAGARPIPPWEWRAKARARQAPAKK